MNSDLAIQATGLQAAQTQSLLSIKLMKQQAQMEQAVVGILEAAVLAPPPPGQGTLLDKSA